MNKCEYCEKRSIQPPELGILAGVAHFGYGCGENTTYFPYIPPKCISKLSEIGRERLIEYLAKRFSRTYHTQVKSDKP